MNAAYIINNYQVQSNRNCNNINNNNNNSDDNDDKNNSNNNNNNNYLRNTFFISFMRHDALSSSHFYNHKSNLHALHHRLHLPFIPRSTKSTRVVWKWKNPVVVFRQMEAINYLGAPNKALSCLSNPQER